MCISHLLLTIFTPKLTDHVEQFTLVALLLEKWLRFLKKTRTNGPWRECPYNGPWRECNSSLDNIPLRFFHPSMFFLVLVLINYHFLSMVFKITDHDFFSNNRIDLYKASINRKCIHFLCISNPF